MNKQGSNILPQWHLSNHLQQFPPPDRPFTSSPISTHARGFIKVLSLCGKSLGRPWVKTGQRSPLAASYTFQCRMRFFLHLVVAVGSPPPLLVLILVLLEMYEYNALGFDLNCFANLLSYLLCLPNFSSCSLFHHLVFPIFKKNFFNLFRTAFKHSFIHLGLFLSPDSFWYMVSLE